MSKSKGSDAERELIHLFHDYDWSAVRIAGSGSNHYPCADVLASDSDRTIAIECKSTKKERKYIGLDELEQLKKFSDVFGAEKWIGVRYNRKGWVFYKPEELKKTSKNAVAVYEEDNDEKITFEGLIKK